MAIVPEVRRYQESDFEEIAAWAKARGSIYDKDLFPPIGYIVPGIAAYFLYETPSKACWLENMCSNPEVQKEVRDLALRQIVSAILKEAKGLGFKVAYATTDLDSVVNRAIQHNAKASHNQTQLILKFY